MYTCVFHFMLQKIHRPKGLDLFSSTAQTHALFPLQWYLDSSPACLRRCVCTETLTGLSTYSSHGVARNQLQSHGWQKVNCTLSLQSCGSKKSIALCSHGVARSQLHFAVMGWVRGQLHFAVMGWREVNCTLQSWGGEKSIALCSHGVASKQLHFAVMGWWEICCSHGVAKS